MRPEKVAAARQPEGVVATRPGYRHARGLPLTRVQRRPRSLPQMVRTTPGGASEGPGGRTDGDRRYGWPGRLAADREGGWRKPSNDVKNVYEMFRLEDSGQGPA